MDKIPFDKKKLIPIITVSLFFMLFIILGRSIYRDYGVSWDEANDYARGRLNYQRLMGGSYSAFKKECAVSQNSCYYPPFFSMLLYAYAPTGDKPAIYLHRHKLTFAVFAFSVFVFFLIGKKIFKDWKIGLLGSLFLIISPRIFAASFNDPKDVPFLSAYIIGIFTLLLFLEKKNIFTGLLHGISTAVLCSIRTPGLIIIPITILFYFFDLVLTKETLKGYLKAAGLLCAYCVVLAGLVYLFTPFLYTDPIGNFIKIFTVMKQYPWDGYQLYMGQNISNHIPWHYSIVWFAISSPVFYLVLFIIGITMLTYKTAKSRIRAHFQAFRDLYLAAACGILPIIAVILMKSTLYTNNRQMYFCYPPLLLISLYGFKVLVERFKLITIRWQIWAGAILVLGLAYPVYFMVRYHPYQNVYFNFLAGANFSEIKNRFTMDGGDSAVKAGLEFILQTDQDKKISISIYDGSPYAYLNVPEKYWNHLIINGESPKYVIRTYYKNYDPYAPGEKVYAIQVGDTDIMTVYKVDNNAASKP